MAERKTLNVRTRITKRRLRLIDFLLSLFASLWLVRAVHQGHVQVRSHWKPAIRARWAKTVNIEHHRSLCRHKCRRIMHQTIRWVMFVVRQASALVTVLFQCRQANKLPRTFNHHRHRYVQSNVRDSMWRPFANMAKLYVLIVIVMLSAFCQWFHDTCPIWVANAFIESMGLWTVVG